MNSLLDICVILSLFYVTHCAPQQSESVLPEITEQHETNNTVTETPDVVTATTEVVTEKPITTIVTTTVKPKENPPDVAFTLKVYKIITEPIIRVINTPKVNEILRNVGTCLVNGAMELFSFYLPPPFMPLIASVAGLMIPFEPVVMLKEKMPVTSYRRAFNTAMSSFLGTFDKYKMDDDEYDPYMTRKFNRRFMDGGEKRSKL